MILNINNKIDLLEDKYSYLDSYIENYFSQDFVNNIFLDYTNLIDHVEITVDAKQIVD